MATQALAERPAIAWAGLATVVGSLVLYVLLGRRDPVADGVQP
jgi:hypothetical protein